MNDSRWSRAPFFLRPRALWPFRVFRSILFHDGPINTRLSRWLLTRCSQRRGSSAAFCRHRTPQINPSHESLGSHMHTSGRRWRETTTNASCSNARVPVMKNTHEKKHTGVTHLIAVCRAFLSLFFYFFIFIFKLLGCFITYPGDIKNFTFIFY